MWRVIIVYLLMTLILISAPTLVCGDNLNYNNYNYSIVIYSLTGCKACEETFKVLDENNISYKVIKVDNNETAWNELKKIYERANITERIGFPTTVINNKYVIIGSFTPITIKFLKEGKLEDYRCYILPNCENQSQNLTQNTRQNQNNTFIQKTQPTSIDISSKNGEKDELKLNKKKTVGFLVLLSTLLNPCNLALYFYYISAIIVATNKREEIWKSILLFLCGVFLATLLLELSILQIPMEFRKALVNFLAIFLLIIGVIKIVESITNKKYIHIPKRGVIFLKIVKNSFIAGLLYPIILTPCAVPLVVVALFNSINPIIIDLILLMPIVIISLIVASISEKIDYYEKYNRYRNWIKMIFAVLLILTAFLLMY